MAMKLVCSPSPELIDGRRNFRRDLVYKKANRKSQKLSTKCIAPDNENLLWVPRAMKVYPYFSP